MKIFWIACCLACLMIGFFLGQMNVSEKEVTKYVQGETIRDTITNFVPDTVYLAGELRYKYKYKTDTVYLDVSVVDRNETIKATLEDWNLIRDYKRILFDNESGKLSVDLLVQYNELRRLSYSFIPIHKEITIMKKRVFMPFASISVLNLNSFSAGGGFFYYNLGFRTEYSSKGINWGILYKF
ncbi:hypothetical protein [Odoribacter sp. AF15-53]|uniref:hypothetical protein n=1 Tax=Odoribacter sp. AF15-53 TaxID=2292236 RepID=UPI000E496053|nr:hypothetical protein [Odoribacter sp. AF15-53]RHR75502.1 hypothetical protein DWW52_18135 [Odoribacter sp. AF15-53]